MPFDHEHLLSVCRTIRCVSVSAMTLGAVWGMLRAAWLDKLRVLFCINIGNHTLAMDSNGIKLGLYVALAALCLKSLVIAFKDKKLEYFIFGGGYLHKVSRDDV